MSFLNTLKNTFGSGSPQLAQFWNFPASEGEIETLFSGSDGIHIIYKHSFACHICTMSLKRLEKSLSGSEGAQYHFIDVRKDRPLSNKVAELSGIRHESPQLLVLHNGNLYWHGSHGQVTAEAVQESLKELKG